MNKSRLLKIIIPVIVGVVAVTVAAAVLGVTSARGGPASDEGRASTTAAQTADEHKQYAEEVSRIITRETIRQRAAGKEKERKQALADSILSGNDDVWPYFDDAAVLGDSRALGFAVYRFLPYSRVLANGSSTMRRIRDRLPELTELSPSAVYVCYGINDLGMGFWKSGESYASEMLEILSDVREALPDAAIVVSSILPASDDAMARNPVWNMMYEFNEKVGEMCADEGFVFVDMTDTAREHFDEYASDGVHLAPDFYEVWARRLVAAAVVG